MLHNALIAAHATFAIAAFALGLVAVWQPISRVSILFRSYVLALWLMVLFLVVVVVVDWAGLDLTARLLYSGLLVLAVYTGWRGWRAGQDLAHQRDHWRDAYTDDVGFTLIALFDGFVIVGSIDAGASIWLVVAIGVLGVVAGRLGVQRMKQRAARESSSLAHEGSHSQSGPG